MSFAKLRPFFEGNQLVAKKNGRTRVGGVYGRIGGGA